MHAYGHKIKDQNCCPGHSKHPTPGERQRNKKNRNRPSKKRARRLGKEKAADYPRGIM